MTQHAGQRRQQRAIPELMVSLLLQFGTTEPAGNGTKKLYFDKPARRRVASYAGPLAGHINEHMDVYAVVGADNAIITVAHLTEKIRRH